jgi:hypothetical protein
MWNAALPSPRVRLAVALLLIALAGLVFYGILWRTAVELPILDDYQNILNLGNELHQAPSTGARLLLLVLYQHNGYKLMFENAVVFAQQTALGHLRILPLLDAGNLFALMIFLTVAAMSRAAADRATRIIYLVPVSFFLFQLQYASALNFASSSLQHLAAVAFALLSLLLLCRSSKTAFAAACSALILGIASSPNGFFAAPAGFCILFQFKQWRRMAAWIAVTAGMLAVYLYRYQHGAPAPGAADAMPAGLPHINLLYALSFLGAAAGRYSATVPSIALGLLLCGVFVLAIRRGYYRQNPAVFYSVVFILINAVAVSGLRADLGVAQSLASRYRIYSALMLAFSYMFLVESLLPAWMSATRRRATLLAITLVSMLFCALSDVAGARFLRQKQIALRVRYAREWQHCESCAADDARSLRDNPALARQLDAGIYDVNLPVLRESVQLGVYQPQQQP